METENEEEPDLTLEGCTPREGTDYDDYDEYLENLKQEGDTNLKTGERFDA